MDPSWDIYEHVINGIYRKNLTGMDMEVKG
jgi:hypothetical protein